MTSVHTGEDFPARLRRLWKASGLNQQQLADRLIIDRSYFNRLLNGKAEPSKRLVQQVTLLEQVGVTPEHTSRDLRVADAPSPYGPSESFKDEIRRHVDDLIRLAGDDPGRLGWVREQLLQYVTPPEHWAGDAHAKAMADALAVRKRQARTGGVHSSAKTQEGAG